MKRSILVALGIGTIISSAAAIGIGAAWNSAPRSMTRAQYDSTLADIETARPLVLARCEALPGLEKQALQHRLELIQQAYGKLDPLVDKATKMLEAQNVTRPMLFALQTTRIKLTSDKAETESKIATHRRPRGPRPPAARGRNPLRIPRLTTQGVAQTDGAGKDREGAGLVKRGEE